MPSPSTPRSPLEDTTNEYRTPTPSPPLPSAKRGPILRRKSSRHALHPQLDSSESYPSPHDSVYEASIAHSSAENMDWYDAKDWASPTKPDKGSLSSWHTGPQSWAGSDRPSWEDQVLDSSGHSVPSSFLMEPSSPQSHAPHKLYPITEQNSLATLRPGASHSTLNGRTSVSTIRANSPGLNGKKQKSFSLSDLPPSPSPVVPKTPPSPPPSPQSFYTPMEPHHPPPLRTPTPPGLPTFNEPAASNYRLPPPPMRFRDKFRSPTVAEREWMRQTIGLPKGVVMRGEGGILVRGKFTPIKSGHFPPQRQAHALLGLPGSRTAFENVEVRSPARPVVLDQRHVHFTGPRMQSQGTTTSEGPVPATVMGGEAAVAERRKRDERAERVLKRFYWVVGCCGLCEKWDLSSQRHSGGQRSSSREGGDVPLFVGGV